MIHTTHVAVWASRRVWRRGAWTLSAFFVLLGWGALPPCAAAAPFVRAPAQTQQTQQMQRVADAGHVADLPPAPPLRECFIMDNILGNRSRMIQLATLCLLLGLVILMRK
jgi:hypothetical protein